MRFPILRPKSLFRRETVKEDAVAGVVLGVESVPDGLAGGLLAGVNPVAGLYGYLYGMVGGALFTSTAFMTIQATGAMAIIVADVDIAGRDNPARSLVTLGLLTGVVMIVAGVLRLGSFLRFVSNSVMTGFVTAVGINIILGQLNDFTGYEAEGANRVARTIDLFFNLGQIDLPTITIGALTIVLIVVLQRTPLGALGMVVAVVVGSAAAAVFDRFDREVVLVRDLANVPNSLPFLEAPDLTEIPYLIVPALSLAFVGLVQGAAVSAGYPNEDGTPSSNSQDFVGQGAGNIVSGLFQGMPVGGSMSASAIIAGAGARHRQALFFAGLVMAVVVVLFASLVEMVAIPSVAGLLIVVGFGTIKPTKIRTIANTGLVPLTVMAITLILTMLIPLQYAVLVGVGLSTVLFVVQQSSRLVTLRLRFDEDGRMREVDPPETLAPNEVVVLQPYGAVFFATASVLRDQVPSVTDESRNSVVILRFRGSDDAGVTLLDVLAEYGRMLRDADCRLVIVTNNHHVLNQIRSTPVGDALSEDDLYQGNEFVGEALRQAYRDALEWVETHRDEPARPRPAEPEAVSAESTSKRRKDAPDDLPSDQLGL